MIFFIYYLVERGLITVNHVVEAMDRHRKQLPLTGKSHFSRDYSAKRKSTRS